MGESGRYAAVKVNTDLVRGIAKWDLTINAKEVDDSEFGNVWAKTDVGQFGWKATFSGLERPDDPFQQALEAYAVSGALVPDLRFYINQNVYWAPDVATDPEAGARITELKAGQDKDKNATKSFSVSGSGPIAKFGVV